MKAGILAGNAARLYGVDPAAVPCASSRPTAPPAAPTPRTPTASSARGPPSEARRVFAADHPWF